MQQMQTIKFCYKISTKERRVLWQITQEHVNRDIQVKLTTELRDELYVSNDKYDNERLQLELEYSRVAITFIVITCPNKLSFLNARFKMKTTREGVKVQMTQF